MSMIRPGAFTEVLGQQLCLSLCVPAERSGLLHMRQYLSMAPMVHLHLMLGGTSGSVAC